MNPAETRTPTRGRQVRIDVPRSLRLVTDRSSTDILPSPAFSPALPTSPVVLEPVLEPVLALDAPLATVILPVHGQDAAVLEQQLAALEGQDCDQPWELLVADNGVSGDIPALLARYAARMPWMRVLPCADRPGRGAAINQAVPQALSPNLILVDSDDVVSPSYVREVTAALELYEFVGTRLDSVTLNPSWLQGRRKPMQDYDLERVLGHRPAVIGAGMALTRRAFDLVGGFDPEMLTQEDLDLSFRLQQNGVRPFFASAAVVRYRYRQDLRSVYVQERQYAVGAVLLHFKHRGALPRRTLKQTVRGWLDVMLAVPQLGTRSGQARFATVLGAAAGRFEGSLRYRCLHL